MQITSSDKKASIVEKNPYQRVCLAAESHHNLPRVWPTHKLKELPAFVPMADVGLHLDENPIIFFAQPLFFQKQV